MTTKAIVRGGSIYLAHLSGFLIGVSLTCAALGFYFGTAMPLQCSAALTSWIAQQ